MSEAVPDRTAPASDAPAPRRPRWGRRAAAAGVLLLLVSPWWAPPLLRGMDFFRVRHVEVRGARYTPAPQIVDAVAVDTTFSLWDDLEPVRERVARHPQVAEARVSRRLPATLVVTIVEHTPVALVQTPNGLRAHDREGRQLPLDPSRTPVDLPILARRDTAILRLLGDIRTADAERFARISEVRRVNRDELVLHLVTVPVRIRPDVSLDRLALISSVEDDLARRGLRATELDLRFRDQVIARLP